MPISRTRTTTNKSWHAPNAGCFPNFLLSKIDRIVLLRARAATKLGFFVLGRGHRVHFFVMDHDPIVGISYDRKDSVMRRFLLVLTVLLSAFWANPLFAWNDMGHMTVARIAYDRLSDGERSVIVAMLRHHPHLHELLLKDKPVHASEAEWMFLRAATWPDHVRPPRVATHEPVSVHPIYKYHHAHWHYVNFEYRAGQQDSALPARPLPHSAQATHPADRTNIIEQLDHSYLIVREAEREQSHPEMNLNPAEDRAVRLCWLFHLMGDIHQPLHVVTLVDDRIPSLQHGDEGGNKLAIRINHATAPRKLHAVWDDVLGTHPQFNKVVQWSEVLLRDPKSSVDRLPEYRAHRLASEFAEESYQVAKDVAYQNGHLHFALWSRVESHELSENDVPVLTQQAVDQMHRVAERRILLAGCRLADRLKFIVSRSMYRNRDPVEISSPVRGNPPTLRTIR